MDPIGMNLAHGAVLQHINSARPDAPVVPDRRDRRRTSAGRADPVRRVAAVVLRRLADRVEPRRARPACS